MRKLRAVGDSSGPSEDNGNEQARSLSDIVFVTRRRRCGQLQGRRPEVRGPRSEADPRFTFHASRFTVLGNGKVRSEFVRLPLLAAAIFEYCGNLPQLIPLIHVCAPPVVRLSLKVQVVTCFRYGMNPAPILLKHHRRLPKTWKDAIWSFIGGTHNGFRCRG